LKRGSHLCQASLDYVPLILCFHCSWDDRHAPPCPVLFWRDGVLQMFLPRLSWKHDSLYLILPGGTDACHLHPVIGWNGDSGFLPMWLQTTILPISASQVAKITNVSLGPAILTI
jgi:hypothetical protein